MWALSSCRTLRTHRQQARASASALATVLDRRWRSTMQSEKTTSAEQAKRLPPVSRCPLCKKHKATKNVCIVCNTFLCSSKKCISTHYSSVHPHLVPIPEPPRERVNEEEALLEEKKAIEDRLQHVREQIQARRTREELLRVGMRDLVISGLPPRWYLPGLPVMRADIHT